MMPRNTASFNFTQVAPSISNAVPKGKQQNPVGIKSS